MVSRTGRLAVYTGSMETTRPAPAAMDLVYQTLLRLLHVKLDVKDPSLSPGIEVVRGLVEMFRAQGVYDPAIPVGPASLPLVHALNQVKDLPPAWLDFFAGHATENQMFLAKSGEDLGSVMFTRMIKPGSGVNSPSLEWWIKHAPELPEKQSQEWMRRLSMRKSDSIYQAYGAAADENIQKFLGMLMARGVDLEKEEPGRPRQRWMRKQVWWEHLSAQGRMGELVRTPSGIERSLDQMLLLGNVGGAYWQWRGMERKEGEAPHGRKKELMDHWVLHSETVSMGERARRLAFSIDKTQGVLAELRERCDEPASRRKDHRETMGKILDHRSPSGMNLHGWFLLRHGAPHDWPQVEGLLHGQSRQDAMEACVAPDGAGLLLQALRATTGPGVEEFIGWSYGHSPLMEAGKVLDDSLRKALVGDEQTHEEWANLLVDTIVCPSPLDASMKMASFVVSQGMISGTALEKVEQALAFASLMRKATRAATAVRNEQNNKKARYGSSSTDIPGCVQMLQKLTTEMETRGCVLSMTARDWDTLMTEWNMTHANLSVLGSMFSETLKKLKESLRNQGERLALADQTVSSASIQSSRPRL